MAVKDAITLGIGAAPGSVAPYILFGLTANPATWTGIREWTLRARDITLTLPTRSDDLTLRARSTGFTLTSL